MNSSHESPITPGAAEATQSVWTTKRLRFLVSRIEQGWSPQCDNLPAEDDAWGVMKVGCVNGDRFDPADNKSLPPELAPLEEYELKPRDILVSRANTKELLGSAAMVPSGVRPRLLLCDKLFRLRATSGVHEGFLTYFLRTPLARYHYEREATGASGSMQNIGQDTLKNVSVSLPSWDRQKRIAEFLDRQANQIDALIAKKKELIETLKEKRLAVIMRAVTKGLTPDVPVRDSGVPWIGMIPQAWDCANLRRFAAMRTGHTPSRNEPAYWENCDIPWFGLVDVWQLRDEARVYLGETKERISALGLANSAADLLPTGTVVFSRTASVGFSGVMPVPMSTTQDFWNWVPEDSLVPEYLLLLFRSMKQEFERLTMGSTHKTIYQPDAASIRVCLPPVAEQQAIVAYVLKAMKSIDEMVAKVEVAMARLLEYRSALITASVTGQVAVNEPLA